MYLSVLWNAVNNSTHILVYCLSDFVYLSIDILELNLSDNGELISTVTGERVCGFPRRF